MSEPYDLFEHHKFQDALSAAREILRMMTPEERASAIREVRSSAVEAEVLVTRTMGAIVRELQLEKMVRRDVLVVREKLPRVGS